MSTESQWISASQAPLIQSGEIHLWRAGLEAAEDQLQELANILAPDEAERAAKFKFARDRRRFIVARAALRSILARYLGISAAAVRFEYGPRGKPAVDGPCSIQFNLSHAHELAVCAIASGRRLGIDIEHFGRVIDSEGLASRFFLETETAALLAFPPERRSAEFLKIWTRKEAVLKASGQGLAAISSLGQTSSEEWSVIEFNPDHDYAGAVAMEGEKCALRFWQWEVGEK